jgi:tetratricopeptide (TPR) repeat protein
MSEHPTIDELEKFLEEQSTGENREMNRRVIRHLLSGCSSCKDCLQALGGGRRLAFLFRNPEEFPQNDEPTRDYDAVLARTEEAFSLFLSGGQPVEEPPGSLLAELAPLPRGTTSHRRSSLPLLTKWLVGRSYGARFDNPEAMQNWALMARLAAETCSAAEAGSAARLADLRTRAWAQLANSFRVRGFLVPAEEAVTVAQRHREAGTGDLSILSRMLGLTAALHKDQGRFREAVELANSAGQISNSTGDYEEEANRLLTQSIAWQRAGEFFKSIDLLTHALDSPQYRNSQWKYFARHNLVTAYVRTDQVPRALALAKTFYGEAVRSTPSFIRLRSLWQEGEILARLGHHEIAVTALYRVYCEFAQKGMPQEIADLCIDLIALYREMGSNQRAERLLTRTIGTLRSLHAEPDVLTSVTRLL